MEEDEQIITIEVTDDQYQLLMDALALAQYETSDEDWASDVGDLIESIRL